MTSQLRIVLTAAAAVALCTAPAATQDLGWWEPRARLQIPRQEVGAAALQGRIWLSGGLLGNRTATASAEVFDPPTGAWSPAPSLPVARHHHGVAAAAGRLFSIGGYGQSFTPTRDVYALDPANLPAGWQAVAPLPSARGAFVAVTIQGRIYVAGGVGPSGLTGDLVVYDPNTDQWTPRAPMPTPREHFGATTVGGKLYVVGGRIGARNLRTLEVYDPATDVWTQLPDMADARGGSGASALDGRIVTFGGEDFSTGNNIASAEEYDPATNQWRTLTPMSVPLHGIYPVTLGDEIVVAGGGLVPGFSVTDTVLALRRLPDGVELLGRDTPGCGGPLPLWPLARPVVPMPFGFAVVGGAPPGQVGVLALGVPDQLGSAVLNARIYVDTATLLVTPPIAVAADGSWTQPLPAIPPIARGIAIAFQAVFPENRICPSSGSLAASTALTVVAR